MVEQRRHAEQGNDVAERPPVSLQAGQILADVQHGFGLASVHQMPGRLEGFDEQIPQRGQDPVAGEQQHGQGDQQAREEAEHLFIDLRGSL